MKAAKAYTCTLFIRRAGKKSDGNDQLKPEHLQYIPVLQQLDAAFDAPNLEIVMQVIGKFSEEPSNLKNVAELLNIQIP